MCNIGCVVVDARDQSKFGAALAVVIRNFSLKGSTPFLSGVLRGVPLHGNAAKKVHLWVIDDNDCMRYIATAATP
jgi:hypothetical protein